MEESKTVLGKFLDPEAIIAQLDISSDSVVADFGCGPGYFSLPFAKAVDKGGMVYALDILPQALETVTGKIKNSGVINVTVKRVNLEKERGSKLESNSVDWVILKDILFQNEDKKIIIAEAWRILKDEGKIIVIEWSQANVAVGPEMSSRIPLEELKKIFVEQKFVIEKDIVAGGFHYAFVAKKQI